MKIKHIAVYSLMKELSSTDNRAWREEIDQQQIQSAQLIQQVSSEHKIMEGQVKHLQGAVEERMKQIEGEKSKFRIIQYCTSP